MRFGGKPYPKIERHLYFTWLPVWAWFIVEGEPRVKEELTLVWLEKVWRVSRGGSFVKWSYYVKEYPFSK